MELEVENRRPGSFRESRLSCERKAEQWTIASARQAAKNDGEVVEEWQPYGGGRPQWCRARASFFLPLRRVALVVAVVAGVVCGQHMFLSVPGA